MKTTDFKHSTDTIDPRDNHLISYNEMSKLFVVTASDLRANGIEPTMHNFTIGGNRWIIYLWSEKYQLHICYKWNRKITDPYGDLIADVFVPYFGMISTLNETRANQASLGTELHILND